MSEQGATESSTGQKAGNGAAIDTLDTMLHYMGVRAPENASSSISDVRRLYTVATRASARRKARVRFEARPLPPLATLPCARYFQHDFRQLLKLAFRC